MKVAVTGKLFNSQDLFQIYDVLEKIYVELYNTFQFTEFHMGADEV